MDFRKTVQPLFVDPHIPVNLENNEMLDLVLSPSFYWVKRVSLPIKHPRDIKKFLPSLFEDSIPKGKYNYYAYADGEAYLVFAYDDKNILRLLAEQGIDSERINKVYFAQSEFQDVQEAIGIDEDFVLDVENHVVVKLPNTFVKSFKPLDMEKHRFSEHEISLARYGHIATTKSLVQFAVFMGALIAVFALDWAVSEVKINEFDSAPLELYTEFKLPATKIQNEAIFDTLQKRYEKQIKIRKITEEILNLNLKKGEYVDLYDLQADKLIVELSLATPKQASSVVKAFHGRKYPLKEQYKNGLLRLEFKL